MKTRAICLTSGGLDSVLAARLLIDQGIAVTGVNFVSPFFNCSDQQGRHVPAMYARETGISLVVKAMGRDYIEMLRNPLHGRGRYMNACVDCHIYMLRRAAEVMQSLGADFVATGEVLGQRPLSQHRQALELIARRSGLGKRLVRPLSARLLEPSEPETRGLIDRQHLLAIEGRARREQLDLARHLGVTTFSKPAGGCLLTDPVVSRRLADLFEYMPDYDMLDVRLLSLGRHFRLSRSVKAIMGRNATECGRLARLADRHQVMEIAGHPGPLVLVRQDPTVQQRTLLGRLLRRWAKKVTLPRVSVRVIQGDKEESFVATDAADDEEVARLRI